MEHDTTPGAGVTIGFDVGDKRSEAVMIDAEGKWMAGSTVPTTRTGISTAFAGFDGALVVLEVGTHSPWITRLLEERGFRVLVANSRRVRLIAKAHKKNDKVDAETLARLGRADPHLLAPVQHRSEQAQRHLGLIHTRDGLVQSRTATINQARGLAKSLGYRLPPCGAEALPKRARVTEWQEDVPGLGILLDVIETLTGHIRALDRRIEQVARTHYPEHRCLTQVTGVGTLTALTFMLVIQDPHRFAKSRDAAAYVGLVPRQRDSGERHSELGITKSGDALLRRLLVSSAHYIVGPFGPESDLRSVGQRLAGNGGLGARNRATVAVARKLTVLLHRLWLTGEVYQPVGYDPRGGHLFDHLIDATSQETRAA